MIPKQAGTVTRHDLQDLRRRLVIDRAAVEDGALDGADILGGAIENLTQLINKVDGRGWIAGNGYRYPGTDGSYPEEVQR